MDTTSTSIKRLHDLLKSTPAFAGICEDAECLKALGSWFKEVTFSRHDKIMTEGETGDQAYILVSGTLSVLKTTLDGETYKVASLLSEVHPFFGEGTLLDTDPRSATIVAESDCVCLALSRQDFETFCAQHPAWALPILHQITQSVFQRLRKANQDLLLLHRALIAEIRGQSS
jgi:CRP/FNR family cyclic AMP-dependent transcriptional regulator